MRTGPAQKLTILADQVISAQVTSLTSEINFLGKEELHPSVQRLLGMDEQASEHLSDEHFKEEHFKTEHYNAEQFKARRLAKIIDVLIKVLIYKIFLLLCADTPGIKEMPSAFIANITT